MIFMAGAVQCSAAMQGGTGLNRFARQFPARFFDVGIAEGHAVAMAAGMAKQGMRPVFAVYSSFLQRSYDMLLHDVALQKLHVVLAVDRAGLVGEDGETHHGVFDPAFLDTIPGMTVLCPSSFQELREMLRYAIYDVEGPVAVRYSRGGEGAYQGSVPVEPATLLRTGADITLAGYGMMLNQLLDCADRLARNGIQAEVVSTMAICGSIITNLIATTSAVLVGSAVVAILPAFLDAALKNYAAAAIFGGTFGNFAVKYPKIAVFGLLIPTVLKLFIPIPAWMIIVCAVFGTLGIARLFYNSDQKKENNSEENA